MSYILIVLIVFLCLFGIKNNGLSLTSIVLFIYILMLLSSFPLSISLGLIKLYVRPVNTEIIMIFFMLFFLLLPFVLLNTNKVKIIEHFSIELMDKLSYIIIVSSFISIIYFSVVVFNLFTKADLSTFRHLLVSSGNPYIDKGFINTFSGTVATFYTLPLFLFYFYLSIGKIKITLFFASLSYPIFVLAYMGRDGALFWFFSNASLLLLFYRFINYKTLRVVKRILFFFSIIFLVVFLFVTFNRFGSIDDSLISIFSYLGQPILNLIKLFDLNIVHSNGNNSFNLFFHFFNSIDYKQQYLYSLYDNIELSWTFGTILKNLYVDFGFYISLCILMVVFVIISFYRFKVNRGKVGIIGLFVFFCYSQIILQGVFYFRQYNDVGNLYIIVIISMAFIGFFVKYKYYLERK
ncbi:hypothetical protein CJF25_14165 [Photobacterium phosphoreum]|uniref:O-antigen polymerase n=1 Tax=Photobacterium phosphoreum TaxID=659 RepID=UPI001E480B9C|nr:O-antigen polymerase [Photobacterium phosphoreum]MCD9464115.1 hypothetical protein [Photobacterium phosphoreum]